MLIQLYSLVLGRDLTLKVDRITLGVPLGGKHYFSKHSNNTVIISQEARTERDNQNSPATLISVLYIAINIEQESTAFSNHIFVKL